MPARRPDQDDYKHGRSHRPDGPRDVAAAWVLLMVVAGLAGAMALILFGQ